MRRRIVKFVLVVFYLALPQAVGALAIAEIEVNSSLNQPLDARIFITAGGKSELNSLKIDVKGDQDGGGSQYQVVYQHEIKAEDGGHYINITSREVIREPVLHFILELNWSEGHLIRKYSLLIDPR